MVTDAGFIPRGTKVAEEVDGVGRRECTKCNDSWKPARAHHCRVCNRCVFRMDHHCPWVNNCVGFGNQKFFLLLGFYGWLSSLIALATCLPELLYCGAALGRMDGGIPLELWE